MVERLTANKVRIFDIINGKYFPGSKEAMRPGYVITPFGDKVSRVSLVATVTEKFLTEDRSYSTIDIDDGTGAVQVRVFKEDVKLFDGLGKGDLIVVIGKIREYNGETYINGEVIRKLEDSNFETYRKLETLKILVDKKKVVDEIRSVAEQMSEDELKSYIKKKYSIDEESLTVIMESKKLEVDYKPKVLEVIDKLDTGEGVEISKLFDTLNMPEQILEKTLDELLNLGFIFEPKVGFLKKI